MGNRTLRIGHTITRIQPIMQSRLINKLHGSGIPPTMSYKDDSYTNYADVKSVDVIFKNPQGATSYSLSDSSSPKMEFFIDNYHIVDPKSVALYFKVTVTGTSTGGNAALCNFAHSVIQGATATFEGTAGQAIEDNQNYNVFCSMMYQFFGKDYIEQIMGAIGGYDATTTNRIWNGKSFTIPVELGFFQSLRKQLPMFMLPRIRLEFSFSKIAQAVVTSDATASSNATVTIDYPQLVYRQTAVSDEYQKAMRDRVSQGSNTHKFAYEAWSYTGISHTGSITGEVQYPITSANGLRKIMFAQVLAANDNVTTKDGINTFSRNLLSSYRFKLNGSYFPSQAITTGSTSADTGLNNNASLSYYLNMLSMGALDRDHNGLPKTSTFLSSPASQDPDTDTDIVFSWNLLFDDRGTTATNAYGSSSLDLVLTYGALSSASKIHVFFSTLRGVRWTGPNSVEVISDQYA